MSKPAPATRKVAIPKHPLAELGGRSMPEFGHIGGAKAVGSADKQFDRQLDTALTAKRKREEQVREGTLQPAFHAYRGLLILNTPPPPPPPGRGRRAICRASCTNL